MKKNQVCTNRVQSLTLLRLGLSPLTATMSLYYKEDFESIPKIDVISDIDNSIFKSRETMSISDWECSKLIPAWDLNTLIRYLPYVLKNEYYLDFNLVAQSISYIKQEEGGMHFLHNIHFDNLDNRNIYDAVVDILALIAKNERIDKLKELCKITENGKMGI